MNPPWNHFPSAYAKPRGVPWPVAWPLTARDLQRREGQSEARWLASEACVSFPHGETEASNRTPVTLRLHWALCRRMDETDDAVFYSSARLVKHIDDSAIRALDRFSWSRSVSQCPGSIKDYYQALLACRVKAQFHLHAVPVLRCSFSLARLCWIFAPPGCLIFQRCIWRGLWVSA